MMKMQQKRQKNKSVLTGPPTNLDAIQGITSGASDLN